jgi:16S rRNA (cytidine1402-2'-O)-methyltransferase
MVNTLYLIPNLIADNDVNHSLPSYNMEIIKGIDCFAVESAKATRKLLKISGVPSPFDTIRMLQVDEDEDEIMKILTDKSVEKIGLVSDAGAPAIADPGSWIVWRAHQSGWKVVPLVGPSSILMAMMACGGNGQGFTFNGYLPVQATDRIRKIRELEQIAFNTGFTQMFIETPYRNTHLLATLLQTVRPNTIIGVSMGLQSEHELVVSDFASEWHKRNKELPKEPAIFSIFIRKPRGRK